MGSLSGVPRVHFRWVSVASVFWRRLLDEIWSSKLLTAQLEQRSFAPKSAYVGGM
jgi:hypothetical protein